MRKLTATICLTLIIFIGSGGVSWGASCEKGVPASIGGKPLTFINEWLPRAEKLRGRM